LDWGLVGLLIGMISGALVAGVLAIWWLRQSIKFKINTDLLREMLSFSAPLIFSGVTVWISHYVDRMMISYYLTVEEVGLYGIGYRLAAVAALFMVGFKGALTPLIYANYHKPSTPSDLEKIFRFFLFFSLLLFLFVSLFAVEILQAFTAPPFYSASVVVVFLVPAILLQGMYIFSPGISIEKKTKFIIWINLSGCMLNILFNYLLIPVYGISGAAIAKMISYGVVFFLYTIIGNKFYPIPHRWPRIYAAVGFAASIYIALTYFISRDGVDWGLKILSILCFAIFAIVVGLIKREEFFLIWILMKKKLIKQI
jgi:O-antigen/teichoic acid export membrane protein